MNSFARKKLIREYYSKRSKDYDRQKSRTWKSSQGFDNEVFDELLTALKGFRSRLLLEVGVGSGRNALPLLEKIKPQLIGLDLSKEMLKQAKRKMSSFKDCLDLILADGEHLPFVNHIFDALVCMSTMHYFASQGRILEGFGDALKEDGTLIYGDLTVHETDNQGFFEGLERTISKAHARYRKPSQIERLTEKHEFHVSKMKTVAYRKLYKALMEDKGQYFDVTPKTLHEYIEGATAKAKEQYELTGAEMTLFYTVIIAKKRKLEPRDPMKKKSVCIKTPKEEGEKTLALTNRLGLINKDLEIQRDGKFIYIPLARRPSAEELKTLKEQVSACKISIHSLPERKKTRKSLVQLFEDKLPPHLLAALPHAVDFVGDIAIVEVPSGLDAYKPAIGEAILKTNRKVRTVLAKAGAVEGTYRLREFTVIAGEPKTETIHKEYGCQYHVDVAKAFFSPRLSFEHRRVATLVQDGETVVDLFAGVGPFSIQIAKNRQDITVYAVDVNPDAVEYLRKNTRTNKVIGRVHPILGDARQVVKSKLFGVADRVIMNLPERAFEFVDVACEAIKPSGGAVHFYSFVNKPDSLESLKVRFADAVKKCGRRAEKTSFSRLVRETAPYEWQAVLDVKIC